MICFVITTPNQMTLKVTIKVEDASDEGEILMEGNSILIRAMKQGKGLEGHDLGSIGFASDVVHAAKIMIPFGKIHFLEGESLVVFPQIPPGTVS
jgi:hypothetical protein